MCPECGSLNLTSEPFDFGTCAETGYQDAGEGFHCLDCGARGPAEDADDAPPARIAPQRERGAATQVVEQWDGARFVERRLVWDAASGMYADARKEVA